MSSDAQLPALYNQALAMVTPSFYEGFGLTALEAMACGTAPIVSCVASLPEIVGDVGLLIDPRDTATISQALKTALTDDRLARGAIAGGAAASGGLQRWIDTGRCVLECYDAALRLEWRNEDPAFDTRFCPIRANRASAIRNIGIIRGLSEGRSPSHLVEFR